MKGWVAPILLVGLLAAGPGRAEDASPSPVCDVPAYLLSSESSLPKVATAIRSGKPLEILVVGSRSSTIATSDGSAYPGRLQVALREKLAPLPVNVTVRLQPKMTAEDVAPTLEKFVGDAKPALVVWQTGTVDAMRSVDPDDFRAALDDGVTTLQRAGADVVLMNLQYSPRMETMISETPYIDIMRIVAQEHDVPLFDRFAIMRHWNEAGVFDLFSTTHGIQLAQRVHDCLARALSTFVIEATRLNPSELRTQR